MPNTVPMSVQDALWLTMDRPNNLMVVDGAMVLRGTADAWRRCTSVFCEDAVERFPVLGRKRGAGPDWGGPGRTTRTSISTGTSTRRTRARARRSPTSQQFMAEQRSQPLPKDRPLWTGFLRQPSTLPDGTRGAAW